MGWYEALQDAINVADGLRNAELKQKLAALQVECAKLSEENARLRQELIELREQVETRRGMQYRDNVYWRRSDNERDEGPFCPRCLDGHRRAARMAVRSDDDYWRCPVCECIVEKQWRNPFESSYDQPDYDSWQIHKTA